VSAGSPDQRAARNTGTLPPAGRALLGILRGLRCGDLTLVWPDGSEYGFTGADPGPSATLVVRDPAMARRTLLGGGMGLAEAYLDGQWTTPDLVALLDLMAQNLSFGAVRKPPAVLQPVQRLIHLARPNSRRGARKNILYHYDLGNDFYRLWLDPTMTYSCALFYDPEELAASGQERLPAHAPTRDLEQAQRAKWDRLLGLLRPAPESTLLEIGCGWGGFAIHAAETTGCRVTGITISDEQAKLARERVREAGLDGRVEIRLQDYRDVPERFDAIASVEMFEAVGEAYWPAFFRAVRERLKPNGLAAFQVITIPHERFLGYRRRADFIQKYIFPGGMLPSPEAFATAAEEAGLSTDRPSFFGQDYALTLSAWLHNVDAARAAIRALGFDRRFERMWRYYLAYCIAGFRNAMIDVMQVTLRPVA
jgi:cyclopropane-fatty-acyl-phospholipid synthase